MKQLKKQTRLSMKLLREYMYEWNMPKNLNCQQEELIIAKDFLQFVEKQLKSKPKKSRPQI